MNDLALGLLRKQSTRIELCKRSFKYFVVWYFSDSLRYPKLATYHHKRFKAVEDEINIYCEGHRESAKTTLLGIAYEARLICYAKARFICNLCYDAQKAKGFNFMLANVLGNNQKIIQDFGKLYAKRQRTIKDDDFMLKSGIGEFITTNGIKIKAFGMGQALRGEIHYHHEYGIVRPDFLLLDDLDNIKNTKNKTMISDDFSFLQQEVFGGLDAQHRIVCLGNVVRPDGRNVRIKNEYINNSRRKCFSNFIYGEAGKESGKPLWSRYVNTDQEASNLNKKIKNPDAQVVSLQTKKAQEGSGYLQNWLGIPMSVGQTVIELKRCKKVKTADMPEKFTYIQIGGDPAFSTKTSADSFGIVVTGHLIVGEHHYKYVLKAIKLQGEQKLQENVEVIFDQLYRQYGVSMIKVESNNGGTIFARALQKRHLAVEVVSATKDKLTRLKEYEGDFMREEIFFLEGETEELINQLINFTGEDGNEDDLVDAMVWSFDGFSVSGFVI
ncbi:MAG: hypothetical protein HXJ92_01805 [candidate division SR1 bacterium]|nr:hypothetical protein [candidate division SR1 bacterium]